MSKRKHKETGERRGEERGIYASFNTFYLFMGQSFSVRVSFCFCMCVALVLCVLVDLLCKIPAIYVFSFRAAIIRRATLPSLHCAS